jgi:glycosyltransferase involved in cell wall biosynthesis
MLTHNRANYTRICLKELLDSLPKYAKVIVWDNNSDEETKSVISALEGHSNFERVHYSKENLKLRTPTNWFWEQTEDCDFVSKVDDDCLQSQGWCERLLECHEAFPESGIIGSWRFYKEDCIPDLIKKKTRKRNNQSLFLNCWVQGSGYLLRRSVIDNLGPIHEKESFPQYCIRAANKGYLNGFAYPFVFENHFDDPRSEYSEIQTDEDLKRYMPLSANVFNINTVEEWLNHNINEALILQNAPYKPSHYIGIRAKLKNILKRIRLFKKAK